jgi:hypothetical protein
MQLSAHFTLAEFTASETAARHGISNDLPAELLANAKATCEMLERIRKFLTEHHGLLRGAPIFITSGYRGVKLNALIGGSKNSAHTQALAADWHCPVAGRPVEIARLLAPHVDRLGIGQLINEFPSAHGGWVHTQVTPPAKAVNRVITIARSGVHPGILEVA